jgi:hypothetical protein
LKESKAHCYNHTYKETNTYHDSLLLDNIARMNHHYHDGQTSKNMSDDSDLISTSGNSSSSSSETEGNSLFLSLSPITY